MDVDSVILSRCYCTRDDKSKKFADNSQGHVHCPCEKCNGDAVYYMTAWRHVKKEGIIRNIQQEQSAKNDHGVPDSCTSIVVHNDLFQEHSACSDNHFNFAGNEENPPWPDIHMEDGEDGDPDEEFIPEEEMLQEAEMAGPELEEDGNESEELNSDDDNVDLDVENNVKVFVRDAILKLI